MAYDVTPDGGVTGGRVFFDATPLAKAGKKGLPDGLKIDDAGNLFATGPGGVLVFSPTASTSGRSSPASRPPTAPSATTARPST